MPVQTLTSDQAAKLHNRSKTDLSSLTREECYSLDAYIENYACEQFNQLAETLILDSKLREYVRGYIRIHMGSVEVDDLMIHFKCYPDFVKAETRS